MGDDTSSDLSNNFSLIDLSQTSSYGLQLPSCVTKTPTASASSGSDDHLAADNASTSGQSKVAAGPPTSLSSNAVHNKECRGFTKRGTRPSVAVCDVQTHTTAPGLCFGDLSKECGVEKK